MNSKSRELLTGILSVNLIAGIIGFMVLVITEPVFGLIAFAMTLMPASLIVLKLRSKDSITKNPFE